MRKGIFMVFVVVWFLVFACAFILLKNSNAQDEPYVKISWSFNERQIRQVIPHSYGRLVAAADNRLYFVDSEENIRIIPIRSHSVLDNTVYLIKRTGQTEEKVQLEHKE